MTNVLKIINPTDEIYNIKVDSGQEFELFLPLYLFEGVELHSDYFSIEETVQDEYNVFRFKPIKDLFIHATISNFILGKIDIISATPRTLIIWLNTLSELRHNVVTICNPNYKIRVEPNAIIEVVLYGLDVNDYFIIGDKLELIGTQDFKIGQTHKNKHDILYPFLRNDKYSQYHYWFRYTAPALGKLLTEPNGVYDGGGINFVATNFSGEVCQLALNLQIWYNKSQNLYSSLYLSPKIPERDVCKKLVKIKKIPSEFN